MNDHKEIGGPVFRVEAKEGLVSARGTKVYAFGREILFVKSCSFSCSYDTEGAPITQIELVLAGAQVEQVVEPVHEEDQGAGVES